MNSLKTGTILLALFTLLLGILYPFFMYGVGEVFFHQHTNGMLFHYQNKTVLGSEWIAQNFVSDKYFHPRPSAAGYDAANSSASNLGPTSQKLIDTVRLRAADYRAQNRLDPNANIPADAVTASGSGLDPDISVENAKLQSGRIASARGFSQATLDKLIADFTEGRTLGIFGEERINVLRINLALDKLSAGGNK